MLLRTEWDARKRWVSETKKSYRVLKVSHKFLNFWGKTIWGNYDKGAKSKSERRYQIDKITYAKDEGTLNAYMCAQWGMSEGSKNWSLGRHVLSGWPQINVMEYFLCIGPAKYPRALSPARKMSLFPSIIMSHVRFFYPMR